MRKAISIGKWDIELSNALHPWSHFKIHHTETGKHIVWGKLSLVIEDGTLPVVPICAECGSEDIGEKHCGDEGWTVCDSCRAVERGYRYISKREWEAK